MVFADPPGSSNYIYAEVPVGMLNDEIVDVAFVNLVDWYHFPGGLLALVRAHRFYDGGVSLGEHWKHKYLVDIDGMGYSGRFLSFMESDSAVMKSTVHREFLSDWIQPWYVLENNSTRCCPKPFPYPMLHYIPVSQSYQEIYNIHAFFSGATPSTLKIATLTASDLLPDQRCTMDGDRRLGRIAGAGKQWKRTIGRRVDMDDCFPLQRLNYLQLTTNIMVPTMIDPAVVYLSEEGYDALDRGQRSTSGSRRQKVTTSRESYGLVGGHLSKFFASHDRQLAIASDWFTPAAQGFWLYGFSTFYNVETGLDIQALGSA
ncbi:hypothetical protein SCP_0906300 [Sparassis crispa]|uniref:Glycosyl transferase CAP10 domain-containing protein n=1 Tax=Sparassis crispa TaxID=139825 RepID=A0A401GX62_9APHY|nr:hypothetical protein SCP_0906300 [Sparassis crispa]GBE86749.1 hypothetical protein SCP_0906300 [Sparassis crispa]